MTKYLKLLWLVFMGNLMKLKAKLDVMILNRVALSDKIAKGVMISLTSYGKRVTNNSVCYTLYSLLKQHIRAERIVLWLDENEFSDDTLPPMLKRLKKFGVEVLYCPNWKSYKKLVPALMHFPEYDIITADDDLYYTSTRVGELINTHHQHPNDIITQGVRYPAFNSDGTLAPYRNWTIHQHVGEKEMYDNYLIMPLGGYGTYYPAGIFDKEILNIDTIQALCPLADDLWFYVMGLRQHIRKENVRKAQSSCYQLDLIRQHFSHDRLYVENVGKDQNDVQLEKLLNHYGLRIGDNKCVRME